MSSSGRRARRPDAEDDSLSSIAREAEARLAAKRAARAEAREIRLKELEKQQREMDDLDSQNGDIAPFNHQESNGSLPPVRSTNSRHLDTDYSTSNGSNGRVRVEVSTDDKVRRLENTYFNELKELRDSSSALEEKYKKAMVQNAQLDNEKTTIHYENQHMRNLLEEREDDLANSIKELNEKCQEAQRLKTITEAQSVKLEQMKELIRQKDQIIQDKASKSGGMDDKMRELSETLLWRENKIKALEAQRNYFQKQAQSQVPIPRERFPGSQDGGLVPDEDNSEMEQLRAEVEQLKAKLMEEQSKSVATGNDEEFQVKEKLHQDTKARANKAEQEVEAQKAYIARLEGQVSRYKAAADHYECAEDDLKAEKRRLQREIRALQDKNEELELTNEHLEKRLEKIRQARLKS